MNKTRIGSFHQVPSHVQRRVRCVGGRWIFMVILFTIAFFVEEGTGQNHNVKARKADADSDESDADTTPKRNLGNDAAKCEEHRTSGKTNIIDLMNRDGLIADTEDASFRNTFSSRQINISNTLNGCAPKLVPSDCSRNICYNLRYRTADGTCNNFEHALFGASTIPYRRVKKPVYDDDIQAVTASITNSRPSTRDVSRLLLTTTQIETDGKLNTLLMQFGQFIVHDMTRTSLLPAERCVGCTAILGQCTPIVADPQDSRFGCANPPCCVPFARAAPVCGTGTTTTKSLLNENTAFLDGSMIYGSSIDDQNRLRAGPFLRSTAFQGQAFMPHNLQQCRDATTNCDPHFDTGDDRVTIFVGLGALHTLFLREHNRIASTLQQLNPSWSDDRVFQETRKIIGAMLQAIAYKEFLPHVLGETIKTMKDYKKYDDTVDPSISSEFAHASMRFGHGMIRNTFNRVGAPSLKFEDGVLSPQRLLFEGGVDALVLGMMSMPLKKPQRVVESVTEKMFIDLVAINLQRGRDAGLPSYNEWRDFCGLDKADSFEDLKDEISDNDIRTTLQQVYGSPDAIDLYAGTLLEDPVEGGLVGPTPGCVIANQFRRLRDGDRFWYQNRGVFTSAQVEQLEKITFARILCDSGDNFDSVSPRAFRMATGSNTPVACSSIPQIDFNKWRG